MWPQAVGPIWGRTLRCLKQGSNRLNGPPILMLDSAKLVMAPGSEHKGAWTFLIRA